MKKSNIALAVFFTAMFVLALAFNDRITFPGLTDVYTFNKMDSLIKVGSAKPLGSPDEHGVYRGGVLMNNKFYAPSDLDKTYEKRSTCRYQ